MVKMMPGAQVSIGFVNLEESSVDRSRWKFDENGFMLAKDAALKEAERQVREAINGEHKQVLDVFHPVGSVRSIDGVEQAPDSAFKLL